MWVELYNDVRLQYRACWCGGGPHLAWVGGGAPCPGAGPCCAAPAQRSSCAAQQTGGRRAFHRWPLTKVGRRFIICRGKRHIPNAQSFCLLNNFIWRRKILSKCYIHILLVENKKKQSLPVLKIIIESILELFVLLDKWRRNKLF